MHVCCLQCFTRAPPFGSMRHFLILQYACVCWSWFVCLFTWLPCLLASLISQKNALRMPRQAWTHFNWFLYPNSLAAKQCLGNISSKILVRLIVLGSYRLYYLIAIPGPLLKQKGRYWGCKIYVKIWSTLRKLRWVVASTCLLKSLWTNPGKVVCYSAQLFFFCKRAWKPRWFQCDAFGVDSTPCWQCFFRV